MSGRQFLIVFSILMLSGVVIGIPVQIYHHLWGLPPFPTLLALPFFVALSLAFVVLYALVGAVLMSVALLLMRDLMPYASTLTWVCAGAVMGSLIGALHPLVVLVALTDNVSGGVVSEEAARLAGLTAICGGVAGLAVGWWYQTRELGTAIPAPASAKGMP